MNGDRFDDVIAGSYFSSALAGTSYVIFGHNGAFTDIDLFTVSSTGSWELQLEACWAILWAAQEM